MQGGEPGKVMDGQPAGMSPGGGEIHDIAENNNDSLVILGVCVVTLILGLVFVVTFKKRKVIY